MSGAVERSLTGSVGVEGIHPSHEAILHSGLVRFALSLLISFGEDILAE